MKVLVIGGGGKTRKWKVLAKAIRRGRYKLGPIVLRSGDPFGLFPRETRVPTEALLLVYPRVVPLPHWQLPGSMLEGGVLTGQDRGEWLELRQSLGLVSGRQQREVDLAGPAAVLRAGRLRADGEIRQAVAIQVRQVRGR